MAYPVEHMQAVSLALRNYCVEENNAEHIFLLPATL